jgi:hypothetical protein
VADRPLFSSTPAKEAQNTFALQLKGAGGLPGSAASSADAFSPGAVYNGLAGLVNAETEMVTLIEFAHVTPVAVQLYNDPSVWVAPAVVTGEDSNSWNYVFSASTVPPVGSAQVWFNDADLAAATELNVRLDDLAPHAAQQILAFAQLHPGPCYVVLQWIAGGDAQFYGFYCLSTQVVAPYLRFTLDTPRDPNFSTPVAEADALLVTVTAAKPQPAAPNATAVARVTYGAGTTGNIVFDADWAGGFVVHAKRLSVSRVNRALDPRRDYVDGVLRLALTLCPAAPHSPHAATLTYLPTVIVPTETRLISIPPLARRVSLLCLYELGDAPLALMHLAFTTFDGTALHWIDALSARAGLFGEGLDIPAGAAKLALTNRSEDPALALGALFHLSL